MNVTRRLAASSPVPSDDELSRLVADEIDRADAEGIVDVAWLTVDTPIGDLTLASTDIGLVRVGFHDEDSVLEDLARTVSPRVVRVPRRLDPVRRELDEYFEGTRHVFSVPIDWRLSRGFRREVLARLHAEVPFGATVSYGELAQRVGNPMASRAVGTAMATNPIPIVVPCHRVLRTGGALGGYGGGLDVKEYLLRLEGALL